MARGSNTREVKSKLLRKRKRNEEGIERIKVQNWRDGPRGRERERVEGLAMALSLKFAKRR